MESNTQISFRVCKVLLWLVLVGYVSVCAYSGATNYIECYDASYISSVAKSLAFEGRYGVWDYQTFVDWPVEVTTGPTVTIPVAIGYKILGDQPFVPNLSVATLVTILLGLALGLTLKSVRNWCGLASVALGVVLLLCVLIKPFRAFYVPLGEASAALCLVIATLLTFDFNRDKAIPAWKMVLAGVFAASAVYAKFLSIMPAATLVAYQAFLIWRGEWKWRYLAQWACGYAVVFFGWELFRLATLGSFSAYLHNNAQFVEMVRMPGKGAGYAIFDGQAIWYKMQRHSSVLFHCAGFFAFLLPLPILLLPWLMKKRESHRNEAMVAAAFGMQFALVGGWWFFLADLDLPQDWVMLRHVLVALFAWPFFAHYLFAALLDPERRQTWLNPLPLTCCLLILGLSVFASPAGVVEVPQRQTKLEARTQHLFEFARQFEEHQQAHPHARYWTAGWWRHWDLQILTGVRFHNILNPQVHSSGEDFFVTSDVFNWENNLTVAEVQNASEKSTVIENGTFKLCKLETHFQYPRPEITEFWPERLILYEQEFVAISIQKTASPFTFIRCNDRILRTERNSERTMFTAKVDRDLLETGELRFELFDPFTGTTSEPSCVKTGKADVIAQSASASTTR